MLELRSEGRVGVITLAGEGKLPWGTDGAENRLSPDTVNALNSALDAVERDESLHAVVVTHKVQMRPHRARTANIFLDIGQLHGLTCKRGPSFAGKVLLQWPGPPVDGAGIAGRRTGITGILPCAVRMPMHRPASDRACSVRWKGYWPGLSPSPSLLSRRSMATSSPRARCLVLPSMLE